MPIIQVRVFKCQVEVLRNQGLMNSTKAQIKSELIIMTFASHIKQVGKDLYALSDGMDVRFYSIKNSKYLQKIALPLLITSMESIYNNQTSQLILTTKQEVISITIHEDDLAKVQVKTIYKRQVGMDMLRQFVAVSDYRKDCLSIFTTIEDRKLGDKQMKESLIELCL